MAATNPKIVNEIDSCLKDHYNEALTLHHLSQTLGYPKFYTTRKFKEVTDMTL